MILDTQQQDALKDLIDYVLLTARNDFKKHLKAGGDANDHVYSTALHLNVITDKRNIKNDN
jgi:hypothetical protein